MDQVVVTVNPVYPLTLIGNFNNCDTINTYSASNYYGTSNFTWNIVNDISYTGSGNSITVHWAISLTNNYPGKVTVAYIDSRGCSSSDSIIVFPCCDDNKNYVNFHDTIIYPSEIVPGNKYYINGVVTIDSNVILLNNEFYMGQNAKINVSQDAQLYILQNSILTDGCEYMWDRVYVNDTFAKLYVTNGSTISDAVNGLVSDSGGVLNLEDANMTNNYNKLHPCHGAARPWSSQAGSSPPGRKKKTVVGGLVVVVVCWL